MRNLTRDEAQRRAALLEVASYDIALDLTGGEEHFASTTTARFSCRSPGADSFVELDGELLSATLGGVAIGPLQGNRLPLPGLSAGEHELVVAARCDYSRTGEGLHRFVDPADGRVYLWAQSFLDDAQRIFACFDQPDLKAVLRLTVAAPDDWQVIGNAAGRQTGGRWHFAPTPPISSYLFTVAAGPWHSVHRTVQTPGRELTFGLHCRQSLAPHLDADADELFEVTQQCSALQEQLFGRRYPFGPTYDQLFVPEFNHGAMENPGAVTFVEDFVFRSRTTDDKRRQRAMVIAHEMAHMWFGDLVTMRWWDDLWLNESFAELLGYLTVDRATRFEGVWTEFLAARKAWGYRADALPSTHPVRGDVPDNRSALLNFDGISYAKGASVLRQLMATIDEDAFFSGVRAYLDRHAWGNTGFADLLAELETASGRPLTDWARVWLQTSGTSTLRVVDGQVRQEADVLRPHRIGVAAYDRVGEALVLRERNEVELVEVVPVPVADLMLPNDGDLTFAKLRLDDRSLATALADLRRLADPLARALAWSALWDTCRDAELSPAAFVGAVVENAGGEADPAIVATLLGQARIAATLYSADGAALLARLAAASWSAAVEASPGSDLQLARLRAWATVTSDASTLTGLLAGRDVPAGLVVDTELRWHLLEALTVLGGADEADLDAELAADRTAAGERHAHAARAGRPDAAAKARAWTAVTSDASLSNHASEALAAGFWRHGQDDLLRPYVERYVQVVPGLFATRSPQVGRALARDLFPSSLVEPDVLAATEVLLDERHPATLRRVVSEQRDDLARALRARTVGTAR